MGGLLRLMQFGIVRAPSSRDCSGALRGHCCAKRFTRCELAFKRLRDTVPQRGKAEAPQGGLSADPGPGLTSP